MVHFSAGALVTDFLIGYMALFSIINPFGVSFVFLSMTEGLTEQARTHIARGVGVYSFVVLVVSLFIGSQIMRFFGITVPALRIAGGLVVALSGWSMLTAPDDDESATPPVPAHATQMENKIFFPLTVPLTTGPGAIATAIALGANRTGELREIVISILASLLIAVLVAVTVMVAYANASTFSRWVGRAGTRVITRLSAFLLLCVGVQIILTGVSDALPALIAHGIQMVDPHGGELH
jgi:multiple antibiotic resistance protein